MTQYLAFSLDDFEVVEVPRPYRKKRIKRTVIYIQLLLEFSRPLDDYSPVPDERLADMFRRGDPNALDELLRRYEPLIHKKSGAFAHSTRFDGEDAHVFRWRDAQREEGYAACVAWIATRIEKGKYAHRKGFTFGSWLQRVLDNYVLDELRKTRRRPLPDQLEQHEAAMSEEDRTAEIALGQVIETLGDIEQEIVQAVMRGDSLSDLRKELSVPRKAFNAARDAAFEILRRFYQP